MTTTVISVHDFHAWWNTAAEKDDVPTLYAHAIQNALCSDAFVKGSVNGPFEECLQSADPTIAITALSGVCRDVVTSEEATGNVGADGVQGAVARHSGGVCHQSRSAITQLSPAQHLSRVADNPVVRY